jgi:hypothetical protein
LEADVDCDVVKSACHVSQVHVDSLKSSNIGLSSYNVVVERMLVANVEVSLESASEVKIVDVTNLKSRSARSDA